MFLKDFDNKTKAFVIQAIRRSFTMSDTYAQVMKNARVEKPKYKLNGELAKKPSVWYRCSCCKLLFKSTDVQVDHIASVVSTSSATKEMSVRQYYNRVHCHISNLQVICSQGKESCHSKKTALENSRRIKLDRSGNKLKKNYSKVKKKTKKRTLK